jgi:hypothetical protein
MNAVEASYRTVVIDGLPVVIRRPGDLLQALGLIKQLATAKEAAEEIKEQLRKLARRQVEAIR